MNYTRTLLALLLIVAACADAPAPDARAVVVSDSAGIVFVRNTAPPRDTLVLREPAVRIGSAGLGGAPEYAFQYISDLAVLPGGKIVVIDNRAARVALFSRAGEWLRDIGREGKGPGEYVAPLRVAVRGDTILVWDSALDRLSRFLPTGEFLGSRRVGWADLSRPIRPFGSSWVDERDSGQLMDPAPARAALVRLSATGEVIDTLVGPYPVPEMGWRIIDEESGRGATVNPPALAVWPAWAVRGERVLWTPGTEPRIEVRDAGGALLGVITLPREAGPVRAADRAAYFRALRERFGLDEAAVARARDASEFARKRPVITRLLVDDRGRIWVAGFDPARRGRNYVGSEWTVLGRKGRALLQVHFPGRFVLMRVRNGRAYGLTTTELGVQVIDVFAIEPKLE